MATLNVSQPNLSEFCINVREAYSDWTNHTGVRAMFACLYSFILTAGVLGNACVILSVARKQYLRTVRNFFLVNLSCSDIVVCLTSVILTPITAIAKNWIFGSGLCYAVTLTQCMSICISTFTLTCIAIDRYILIVHPTKKPVQSNQALIMIFVVWVMAAGLAAPLVAHMKIVSIGNYCGEFCLELWLTETARISYGAVVLVLQFILPFSVMGLCYNRVCASLNQGVMVRRASSGAVIHLTDSEKRMLKRKRRTNRMLIIMVVVFASCWILNVFQNLLRDIKSLPWFISQQEAFFHLVVHWVAMTSTVWNPVLYAAFNYQFRDAFTELIPCLKYTMPSAVPSSEFNGSTYTSRSDRFRRYSSPMKYSERDRLLQPPKQAVLRRSIGGDTISTNTSDTVTVFSDAGKWRKDTVMTVIAKSMSDYTEDDSSRIQDFSL